MAEPDFRLTIDPSLRETVKHLAKLHGGSQRDLVEDLLRDAMDLRTAHAKVLRLIEVLASQIVETQLAIQLLADYVVDRKGSQDADNE